MRKPDFQETIRELKSISEANLIVDGGENLAGALLEARRLWMDAEAALENGDPITCAVALHDLRRCLTIRGRLRDCDSKEIYKALQTNFDLYLNPLTGGKNSSDEYPSPDTECRYEQLLPLLREAFEEVHRAYQVLLENDQALDFDDLEYRAQQLLKNLEIREYWQRELQAVLVDEFQDTNRRQQEIVRALTGSHGNLFMVGDPRQSIYRFRKADVTVFKSEEARISREQGRVINLQRTYRAHAALLEATGNLLAEVINAPRTSTPDYYIPYTSMVADRVDSDSGYNSPHVEFVLGEGEDAESARPQMAKALAARLIELKSENQFQNWDEVALLFRASSGFPYYEEAFEDAGIPFVTVAGKGFYDRPEIRDLINILRALADPMDDLAFAGLLRSPAFGLSDAALYLLSQTGQPYWMALQEDLLAFSNADQLAGRRAREICANLIPMVDRIPVGELLKKVVDTLDYRSLLATADNKGGEPAGKVLGGRLWRNVDKLLLDARKTGQVSVRTFLDTLETLNDAGAREGEAPAEADGSAVLMTIHKSKGLEYPVVVLADAGRTRRGPSENVYLFNELGVTFKMERSPMLYKLAKELDVDQEKCEDLRLLYVALTRAKSKLLISAHCMPNEKAGIALNQWAKELVSATGVATQEIAKAAGKPFESPLEIEYPLRFWCALKDNPILMPDLPDPERKPIPINNQIALYQPIGGFLAVSSEVDISQGWQITQQKGNIPGTILGKIVHKAIQRWLFPDDPRLTAMLETESYSAGLVTSEQRREVTERATELLNRLQAHTLWKEINLAQERYSELPYSYLINDTVENRVIDLLYRDAGGWHIIDFKTDPIHSFAQKEHLIQEYAPQVGKYKAFVESKLGISMSGQLCFLDDQGEVSVVDV